MSFDGMFTHSLVKELTKQFKGGTIRRIQQPYEQEIIFSLRSLRKNYKLLLSTHPSYSRIQITEQNYANPDTPYNFLMVLRKYIEGAKIMDIHQYENDRIVIFDLSRRNEIGDNDSVYFVAEIMGRLSNFFLLDKDRKIIDALKHVSMAQNSFRTILPGAPYKLPPQGDKINPFSPDAIEALPEEKTWKSLQQIYMGLGKDSARELALRLYRQPEQQEEAFATFLSDFDYPKPTLIQTENKYQFVATPFDSIQGQKTSYDSLSELLQAYYEKEAQHHYLHEASHQLSQIIQKQLKHDQTKLANLEKDYEKSKSAEDDRIKGEILTTYLFQLKQGMTSIRLPNYYNNDEELEIALDPTLSPSRNAQAYFKQYTKLKNSREHIEQQRAKTQEEMDYLDSVQTQIELAEPKELQEIRQELVDEGYIREAKKKKKVKVPTSQPREFKTKSGVTILVGRNNRQNDQLTLRRANKNHYWFHAKDIPGSHVILQTDNPSDEDIIEAATLAAQYSKYRFSANVPVDYTQVRYVRKPNGAKPGLVNYFEYETAYVTPPTTESPEA